MMGGEENMAFSRKQIEQASKWVARHERGLTEPEQVAFDEWLAEDAGNEACYFEQQVVWASFDVMDDWKPAYSDPPNPDLFESREKRGWRYFMLYGGMAAMLMLGLWVYSLNHSVSSDLNNAVEVVYQSENYEKHFLEDGSSFYLFPDSEVKVVYSDRERNIEFVRGESQFSVAHDPSRPFVVHSEVGRVTALGTVFSVKQDSDLWEVFVTEGRVKVDESRARGSLLRMEEVFVAEIVAGQKVVQDVSAEVFAPRIEAVTVSELSERLVWKNQIIDMVSAPLEEILLEFRRAGGREVVVADEELKQLRMTVAIKADNLEDFIDLLVLSEGVKVSDTPDGFLELSFSSN